MKTTMFNLSCVLSRCLHFIGAMMVAALIMPAVAFSQPYSNPDPVPLGTTMGTYGALGYSGITGSATVNGDVGTTTGSVGGA